MKHIESIQIRNSSFYEDNIVMKFSEKLNCIMGSRGTGKSTILHFIKACLDPEAEEDRDTYNVLKNNLGEGTIILTIVDDEGKRYRIEKSLEEEPQCYYGPKKEFIEFSKLSNLITCDIYEAQAIEEIGKNSISRLELIDKMILEQKEEIETDISTIQLQMDENTQLVKSENSRLRKILNELKAFEGVEEELTAFQKDKPDDINKKEEVEFSNADKNEKIRLSEKRFVKSIEKKLEEFTSTFIESKDEISNFKDNLSKPSIFLNKEVTDAISKEVTGLFSDMQSAIENLIKKIGITTQKINFPISKLAELHNKQQNEFTQLKQKFEKHKTYYNKWNALSKRADEKQVMEKNVASNKLKLTKILQKRVGYVAELNTKKKELFELRRSKIELLNKSFNRAIRITLKSGGITDDYEQLLKNALKGSNMRYNAIIPAIIQNLPPDKFASIIMKREIEELKKITGIDKERSEAVLNAMSNSDELFEIEKLCCPDLPEFHLRVDLSPGKDQISRNDYRKSEDLSTGQRCTTVLPIAFAVSNNPLIIDQPEDNLDNKYISESIHEIIGDQKNTRQLIFITHNPNIPVLSDAETNFFLGYVNKKSRIEKNGAIDDVKQEILNLLEGGKEAFEKREELYNL